MSAVQTREKILATTMQLIKERNGDIENVTIRMIADRAGIGVGLTNHYFKSKDCLVKECIDSVFQDMFKVFTVPDEKGEVQGPIDATKRAARKVMQFLIENEAVARVAMLLDVTHPGTGDYTTRLINSFAYAMVDRKQLEEMLSNDKINEKMKQQFREHFINEQRIKAFMITSSIKEAFLRMDSLAITIGVDLRDSEKCDEYVDEIVEMLM